MIYLLKLRHYRIESIKPVISKYIQRAVMRLLNIRLEIYYQTDSNFKNPTP